MAQSIDAGSFTQPRASRVIHLGFWNKGEKENKKGKQTQH
jgi:hypothetical protein